LWIQSVEKVRVLDFSVEVEDEDSSSFFSVLQIFQNLLLIFGFDLFEWRERECEVFVMMWKEMNGDP
jgi:hypothetical protein